MSIRVRKKTALTTMVLLLLAHAAPAFDICVCDAPGDGSCCRQEALEPVAAEASCCTATEKTLSPTPHHEVSPPPASDARISSRSCQRQVINAEMASASLPLGTTLLKSLAPLCAGSNVVTLADVDDQPLLQDARRAPPPAIPQPLFLLHATYRI